MATEAGHDQLTAAFAAREGMPARILDLWITLNIKHFDETQKSRQKHAGYKPMSADRKIHMAYIYEMADTARPFVNSLLQDNSDKSPEELQKLACALSPGGAHTSGLLTSLAITNLILPDNLLLSAMLIENWGGGKVGFQFLPDPASVSLDDYQDQVYELRQIFEDGLNRNPLKVLTGENRDFYLSLPSRFSVYRGCAGISGEMAAEGLCWSTDRIWAEWFAHRFADSGNSPVLVCARVKKEDVIFALAAEKEVVVKPRHSRSIKCRARKDRPDGPVSRQ